MSRRVNREAIDEIVMANGDRVWVRQKLTAVEQAELTKQIVNLRYDGESNETVLKEGDWHLSKVNICRAYILRWDFKEDDGTEIPCTPEVIGELDQETVNEISAVIDRLQAEHREMREKKGPKR